MPTQLATQITLRELQPGEDPTPFRLLNEEWITALFALEPHDVEVLNNPETHILSLGGHIYFADSDGETIACVALIPTTEGVYEVSKMAVSPKMRGRGIGRTLLEHAIAQARLLGATSLFLGSSKKLANAVHLYESIGFRHVAPDPLIQAIYARADVFMEMSF